MVLTDKMPPVKRFSLTKLHWALLATAALAIFAVFRLFDVSAWLLGVMEWMREERLWGPVAFIGLYIADCLLFVPGPTLIFGAGIVFGVAQGALLVSFSSSLAALIAFMIGRYLARDWVERQLGRYSHLNLVSRAICREGWKIIALTRLSPLFPFKALNYVYGTTSVGLKDYVVGTWMGTIPGTVTYVYLGSLIGNLFQIKSRTQFRPELWPAYAGGFLASLAITLYTVHRARIAIQRVSVEDSAA